jgi:hypothetical protein
MSDDQTQTQAQVTAGAARSPTTPPYAPDGDEIYDMLMGKIEPELLSYNIPYLREAIESDSPEERRERGERYVKAYEEYDRQFAEYQKELKNQFQSYKKNSLSALEGHMKIVDNEQIAELETAISAA